MKQVDVTMKKIGDTKFYITPFPAFTAARISGELSAVLAPMLGSLSPLLGGDDAGNISADSIMNLDMDTILPPLADALGKLDGVQFEHLAKALLVDYKNIAYDTEDGETERLTYDAANEIFCADIMGMIMLGVEVVRINFGNFFEKIAGQFGSPPDATAKPERKIGTKNGASLT